MMIFIHLFTEFFKIGAFSFGGGMPMLPLIFQSVSDFGLMSPQDFADLVALSQVTPGPIAVNAATFVGYKMAGVLGSIFATLGVISPSISSGFSDVFTCPAQPGTGEDRPLMAALG